MKAKAEQEHLSISNAATKRRTRHVSKLSFFLLSSLVLIVAVILKTRKLLKLTLPSSMPMEYSSYSNTQSSCSQIRIGIKSGAMGKYKLKRIKWRKMCRQSYQEAGIQYKFMVGLPRHSPLDPRSHNQGARFSTQELEDIATLKNESLTFGDVKVLPMIDAYETLFLKTFSTLEWLVHSRIASISTTNKPAIVMIHDDEYCANTTELVHLCHMASQTSDYIYAGFHLWETPGYEIQKGLDGSFVSYFSGWMYALSYNLAQSIVQNEEFAFSFLPGSPPLSEDLMVGRWAKSRKEADRVDLRYVTRPKLLLEVEKLADT